MRGAGEMSAPPEGGSFFRVGDGREMIYKNITSERHSFFPRDSRIRAEAWQFFASMEHAYEEIRR